MKFQDSRTILNDFYIKLTNQNLFVITSNWFFMVPDKNPEFDFTNPDPPKMIFTNLILTNELDPPKGQWPEC